VKIRWLGSLFLFAPVASAAPALRSDMLVSTAWLGQHLNDSNIVILQVSSDHTAYDAGRIQGARLLNELPPAAGLKSVFESLGVSDDSRVILYGDASVLPVTRAYFNAVKDLSYTALNAQSASPVLLDARTAGEFAGNNPAGYDTHMYDGSFLQWSAAKDSEVQK
jgi:3-mercaptopyruvate sulfurtransferase SseA